MWKGTVTQGGLKMKLFIDTANVDEIREIASWGIVDGVTTNPSLIAKEGRVFKDVVREICEIVDGPISAEVISETAEGMIPEGLDLAAIHKNITIKVPMTAEGLKATRAFADKGIKTNVTLVFSPMQALLAAKAGATFISPFLGRLDDISHNGMDLIQQIGIIFDNYGYETQIIAASVRHPVHMVDCALSGAHVATVPYKVIKQLVKHPLTDIGIEKFLADAQKIPE